MKHVFLHLSSLLLVGFGTAPVAWAQLEILSDGKIQIGDQPTNGGNQLHVLTLSMAQDSPTAIFAEAGGVEVDNVFGVKASADGGTNASYALYGSSTPSTGYAGYFSGDLHVTGTFTNPSDARLKESGVSLASMGNVLSRLLQLQPQRFTYTTSREFEPIGLAEGEHFGVIAQDVEAVFPELVKEEIHPGELDEEGNPIGEPIRYKSVNYIELIPVLIQAIQEQQAVIEEQQRRIEALEAER